MHPLADRPRRPEVPVPLRETVDRVTTMTDTLIRLSWRAAAQYVDGHLKEDVLLVRAGLALGGWLVRTGVTKVRELWSNWSPSAFANTFLARRMKRPEKSDKASNHALILTGVAGLSVLGAGAVFAGFVTGYLGGAVYLLSGAGYTFCGTEHLTALRAESGAAADILRWLGGAFFLGKCGLGFKSALKDVAEAGKIWATLRGASAGARSLWFGATGTGRFYTIAKPFVMAAWCYVFPRPDDALLPPASAA